MGKAAPFAKAGPRQLDIVKGALIAAKPARARTAQARTDRHISGFPTTGGCAMDQGHQCADETLHLRGWPCHVPDKRNRRAPNAVGLLEMAQTWSKKSIFFKYVNVTFQVLPRQVGPVFFKQQRRGPAINPLAQRAFVLPLCQGVIIEANAQ